MNIKYSKLINDERTVAFAQINLNDRDIVSTEIELKYLEKAVKALKAIDVYEVKLAIDKKNKVFAVLVTDELGIAIAPRVEEE